MNIEKLIRIAGDKELRKKYAYLLAYAMNGRIPIPAAKLISNSNRSTYRKQSKNAFTVDTYDGSQQAVHPDLVERDGLLWMVCTPYPYSIDTYENPCVYAGKSVYCLAQAATNPIATTQQHAKRNHISDPCIYGGRDGFSVFFRDTVISEGETLQKLFLVQSGDGKIWSEKHLVAQSASESFVSPAVLSEGDTKLLFYVRLTCENGGTLRRCALIGDHKMGEAADVTCNGLPENLAIWHIAMGDMEDYGKHARNGLIGLFLLRSKLDPNWYKLYWAHADNLSENWQIDEALQIPEYLQSEISIVYKSALIPQTGDVMLSYMDKVYRWRFAIISGARSRKAVCHGIVDSYRVFSNVFASPMSIDQFRCKHEQNPYGVVPAFLLRTEDDRVLGTNSFMGAECLWNGNRMRLAQSCDTAVLPEGRGKGVFTGIIAEAEPLLARNGVDAMVGFPNDNSYHGFMKLGWNYLGDLHTMIRITDKLDAVTSKISRGRVYRFTEKDPQDTVLNGVQVSARCSFSPEDLATVNRTGRAAFERTESCYTWKIDGSETEFRYFSIRDTQLRAFAVCSVNRKGRISVVDWYVQDAQGDKGTEDLKQLFAVIGRYGNAILTPMINMGTDEARLLERVGFVDATKKPYCFPKTRFIMKPLSERGSTLPTELAHWRLRFFDADTIIHG